MRHWGESLLKESLPYRIIKMRSKVYACVTHIPVVSSEGQRSS